MQWDDPGQFPGAIPVDHPIGPCALSWVRVSTPDPGRLTRWTEGEADLPVIRGNASPGIDAVAISTSNGDVIID